MRPDATTRLHAMTRLRAANPCVADPERGTEPVAQAALRRILDTPPPAAASRRTIKPRGLVLILAVLLVGAGGALAATDPMGWWSNNPSEARYGVSPSAHVRTPTARQIRCRAGGSGHFDCTPETEHCYQVGQRAPYCKLLGTGLPYTRVDTIHAPPRNSVLSRTGFERGIAKALAAGTMTAAQARRFRSDLARVPDSFFTELRLASRYGTYGGGGGTRNGRILVPPVDQPVMLACAASKGHRISCQDINGDTNTPVGSGIYTAVQGTGWRWVKSPRYVGGLPPGIHFTHAEYQVLIDLLRFGATTTHSITSGHATTVPITHLPATGTRTTG